MQKLIAATSALVLALSFSSTALANLECLDDCQPPLPEEETKGNNGWGNGIDGTNPGSDAGPPSQVETKDNREIWEKFDGKFEGR